MRVGQVKSESLEVVETLLDVETGYRNPARHGNGLEMVPGT
jgi:hypothetical protein